MKICVLIGGIFTSEDPISTDSADRDGRLWSVAGPFSNGAVTDTSRRPQTAENVV